MKNCVIRTLLFKPGQERGSFKIISPKADKKGNI